ncbi:Rrf2 family transcriptional regulator [Pleionea sp. CnH1-48]|uniref:Rrf2 family transcriptional regulator n=1 Tax=Pleionea sp. CnH1-48 TaxID=2954494 RepID=UPI0020975248|nr:Rrf2 family transcriptional regulator [Pleionea sp. CnH1-48]
MRLTTKGRYAVTAMLDLAIHGKHSPVTLNDISGRQEISLSYLEQLFAKLRRNDLVRSVRGPGGGYQLNHEASDISIASIVDAVNGDSGDVKKPRSIDSDELSNCLADDLWCELSSQIHTFLSGISLHSVLQKQSSLVVIDADGIHDSATNVPTSEPLTQSSCYAL